VAREMTAALPFSLVGLFLASPGLFVGLFLTNVGLFVGLFLTNLNCFWLSQEVAVARVRMAVSLVNRLNSLF